MGHASAAVAVLASEPLPGVHWSDLGITGKYIVRDLWRQKDLGVFENEFSADAGKHGVVLVNLRRPLSPGFLYFNCKKNKIYLPTR